MDVQYVLDDRNRALLPGQDGKFSETRLMQSALWKVVGRGSDVPPSPASPAGVFNSAGPSTSGNTYK